LYFFEDGGVLRPEVIQRGVADFAALREPDFRHEPGAGSFQVGGVVRRGAQTKHLHDGRGGHLGKAVAILGVRRDGAWAFERMPVGSAIRRETGGGGDETGGEDDEGFTVERVHGLVFGLMTFASRRIQVRPHGLSIDVRVKEERPT